VPKVGNPGKRFSTSYLQLRVNVNDNYLAIPHKKSTNSSHAI
jgi:hypothetical protein